MRHDELERLAGQLVRGEVSAAEFAKLLAAPHTVTIDGASVDLDRRRRCGFPEVVFAQGKTTDAIERIFQSLLDAGSEPFATRVSPEQAKSLASKFSAGRYNELGRTFRVANNSQQELVGKVVIITAGTSDLPVAEEARETAEWMGQQVAMIHDVGVAGPQRLIARLPEIAGADAVVVIAGMEGALPSVVGGYVDVPVVAVPTSIGYGASLGGIAALLGMLNSCASNVTVVNIDAGFKGAYVASLMARNAARSRKS